MNPLFDVEEDPDNANVLYIAGDYGIHVTHRQGQDLDDVLDVGAERHRPRHGHPEARPRPGHRHVRPGHLHRRHRPAQGVHAREPPQGRLPLRRRGDHPLEPLRAGGRAYGEFAKVDNPPIGSTIYYYLKAEAKAVKLIVKDLEGTVIRRSPGAPRRASRRRPGTSRGGRIPPSRPPAPARAAAARGRGANLVDYGVYKVTLNVDGKDIATKTVKVSPDPLFK